MSVSEERENPVKPQPEDLAAWQARAKGTNVHETTLLATDYLNHFNEIVMLLGMVPDMPEMLEECRSWRPKSYAEHFKGSGVADADFAVEAYDHAPAQFRKPFDQTIAMLDATVASVIERAGQAIATEDFHMLKGICSFGSEALQRLIDAASAIIHGSEETASQAQIDKILQGG